jgi:hypothetical protein
VEAIGRLAGRAVPFNREKAEEMLASGWICDLSGSEALLPPEEVTPLRNGNREDDSLVYPPRMALMGTAQAKAQVQRPVDLFDKCFPLHRRA